MLLVITLLAFGGQLVAILTYRYRAVFVCMGKTYRRAIEGVDAFFPDIRYSHGGIGIQISQLRQFLYNA